VLLGALVLVLVGSSAFEQVTLDCDRSRGRCSVDEWQILFRRCRWELPVDQLAGAHSEAPTGSGSYGAIVVLDKRDGSSWPLSKWQHVGFWWGEPGPKDRRAKVEVARAITAFARDASVPALHVGYRADRAMNLGCAAVLVLAYVLYARYRSRRA
jgi:hypothetical protein